MRFINNLHPRLAKALVVSTALVTMALVLRYAADAGASGVEAGANPHPVHLQRLHDRPLSAVALLGKQIFFDSTLSASGRQSCASCHSPDHAYGPPDAAAVQLGGRSGSMQGARAVPSLRYLYRTPNFSIGPDDPGNETVNVSALAAQYAGKGHAQKTVGSAASAVAMVPQGGLFWDGRVNTFQTQAMGPLLNPVEMANKDMATVAAKLEKAPYAAGFSQLFGAAILKNPGRLVDEALFAVSRYEIEDPSFHPYSSKYDYWLEGRARLTAAESHGLQLFEDKDKANCAGCHLDQAGKDGQPPMFTDFQYEALGVPRNRSLADNRDTRYFDMGLCGPVRDDLKADTQYCAMFKTPSLRNTATRKVFFHNGEYHDLTQVLAFYDFRDTDPGKIYPRSKDGKVEKFDDVPGAYLKGVDVTDPPFDRKLGEKPAMSEQDMRDIIAFLHTLDDGYQPRADAAAHP